MSNPTPADAQSAPTPEEQRDWHRVHPVTPVVQAVTGLPAFLIVIASAALPILDDGIDKLWLVILILVGGSLLLTALIAGWAYLEWTRTRYAADSYAVYLQHGIITKRERIARLNRVQAVDVVQPLVARLFGFARLEIEVAGGTDSQVKIDFLKLDEAERLRRELLDAVAKVKHGATPVPPGETGGVAAADPAAGERQLLEVPVGRLFGSALTTGPFIVVAILTIVLGIALPGPGTIVALPVLIITLLAVVGSQFATGFGHRLAISMDGIRIRKGLFDTRSQTLLPGRVHAVQLHQGIIWRLLGWWRLDVNVAGYSLVSGENDGRVSTQTVLLPIGLRNDALTALWLIVPDLGTEDPLRTLEAAMDGSGEDGGFMISPRRARWFDPIARRHNGVLLTQTVTIIRRGRFSRTVTVIPHARTQSLATKQGPLDQVLNLVTFESHTVPGPATKTSAIHLEPALAAAILDLQAERAHSEAKRESEDEWRRRVGLIPTQP